MDKLPSDYKDYPRSYKGQPRRPWGDEHSTWRDLNDTQESGKTRGPMDALDPEKPTGAQQSKKPSQKSKSLTLKNKEYEEKKKKSGLIGWFRDEKK